MQAQMAFGVKGGSAGIGGEISKSLTDKLSARLSGTFFSYATDGVYADDDPSIAYNVSGEVTSVGLLVDYFPFTKFLKLSAGVFYHDFLVNGDAAPNESYTIDKKTFAPERLGSLNVNMDYESKIVPYAGLGFGNPVASGSRIKLNLEFGAMYTNSPRFDMEGEGMIAPTANYGQDFEDGMAEFKFYPVVNLGITFRIN